MTARPQASTILLIILALAGCASQAQRDEATLQEIAACKQQPVCEVVGYHGHGGCVFRQADCLSDIAINRSDPSLCAELAEEPVLKNVSEDCGLFCPGMANETLRDYCYSLYGRTMDRTEYCGMLKRESDQEICYTNIAMDLTNASICDNIKNESHRPTCVDYAARR
jgi:hypothetical protein